MAGNPIQVMIVEDDPIGSKIIKQFTEKIDGFEISAIANSGNEAFAYLQTFKPQLILLDIYLQDMNGIDLLRAIRIKYRGIDIIPITAANDAETVTEAIRGGVFSYLIKPIDVKKFTDELTRYKLTMEQLQIKKTMDQKEIDTLFSLANPPNTKNNREKQLPKGIDKFTLMRVRDKLRFEKGSVSAEELAILLGITDSTARKYLEYLTSIDEMYVDIKFGSVGRPERKYKWKRFDN
ncbi:response regulator [Bacillus sp. ISL-18]|uniref:response regulator n=1 Tax=Bacillus sp. ISL-18 TaxID=2819118 RepID=UPI001BEB42E6|nr:response regulator [Bacillus sp. ISL-18]MBT2654489.1 response regulator [Bacillus sp. ISL-18]